jgi:hypothetical protein
MDTTTEITGTQIISIDPKQYVAAVYAPFRARLDAAKEDADKIESVDATTKEGMAVAVKHRAVFRAIRTDAEKARVQRKAPILEISRLIDGRYKEIESEILAFENTFDAAIKAEEARKQAEKDAEIRKERERIEAEQAAIKKAEEERMAAERAELARQQAELAAAQKAAQEKIEADARAARLKIEAEERAARLAREEADRVARQAREAEEAKQREAAREEQRKLDERAATMRAEQQRLADEQAKLAAAKLAEAVRIEAEERELLQTFVERFGARKEFVPIAAAILQFLGEFK